MTEPENQNLDNPFKRTTSARKPVTWFEDHVVCNFDGCVVQFNYDPDPLAQAKASQTRATFDIWQHQLAEHSGSFVAALPGSQKPVDPIDRLELFEGIGVLLGTNLERAAGLAKRQRDADAANARIRKLRQRKEGK